METAIECINLAIQDLYEMINFEIVELNDFNEGRLDALNRIKRELEAINNNCKQL